jgi:uncharacterized Fe-S cluster protein YjdI
MGLWPSGEDGSSGTNRSSRSHAVDIYIHIYVCAHTSCVVMTGMVFAGGRAPWLLYAAEEVVGRMGACAGVTLCWGLTRSMQHLLYPINTQEQGSMRTDVQM